jgi:centromeric protein E
MTTALPRPSGPSGPSNGPPNMALPALPMSKTRKSTGNIPSVRSTPTTPSKLRAPSTSHLPPPPSPSPMTALPQPRAVSGLNPTTPKTVRKTVSINSFPQPPRGDNRGTSVPGSPIANDRPRTARKSKSSKDAMHSNYNSTTPSFLNGSGEGKSITSVRMSDGLVSVASETQSRSSSAQDSYSTSATTYDDPADGSTPKPDAAGDKIMKGDGKGNVVVSVRVRPSTNTENGNPEGEWMVDGRRSLISYKGKEGGNHFYGKPRYLTSHHINVRHH